MQTACPALRGSCSARPTAWVAAGAWLPRLLGGGGSAAVADAEPNAVEEVTAEQLAALLEARGSETVVVVMSTAWCGPCKVLSNQLQATATKLGRQAVRVVKVDVEVAGNEALASRLNVRKLPVAFFVGPLRGKPAVRTQGILRETQLEDLILAKAPAHLGCDLDAAIQM